MFSKITTKFLMFFSAFSLLWFGAVFLSAKQSEQQQLRYFEENVDQAIEERTGISFGYPLGEKFHQELGQWMNNRLLFYVGLSLIAVHLIGFLLCYALFARPIRSALRKVKRKLPEFKVEERSDELHQLLGFLRHLITDPKSSPSMVSLQKNFSQKLPSIDKVSSPITFELSQLGRSLQQGLESIPLQERKQLQPVTSKFFNHVSTLSVRLQTLTTRLSELEQNPFHMQEDIDLQKLVHRSVKSLEELFKKENIEIVQSFPEETITCWVDPDSIVQVLTNILKNSCEAMGSSDHKKITIDADFNDDSVWIFVEDSGPGVLKQNETRIFDSFFTTNHEHLGLGLSIAKQIIDAHQGSIELLAANAGARFRIKLRRTCPNTRTSERLAA